MKNWLGIILLFWLGNLFAQRAENPKTNYTFYTWEEVQKASPDTVFAISFRKLKLNKIPEKILEFYNLEAIDFDKNRLKDDIDFLNQLERLEYLSISKNHLEAFPISVCKLTGLKYLDLSKNEIIYLSPCISYMTELKYLDLYNTSLIGFPLDFHKLNETIDYIDARGQTFDRPFVEKWELLFDNTRLRFDTPCNCSN